MKDFIDEVKQNTEVKRITYIMCGDWRKKVDIIVEVEELPENRITSYSVYYDGAQTKIEFNIK